MLVEPERGELGFRVIIAMTLVAAIAWIVPMVFFAGRAADNVEVLTGAGAGDGEAPSGDTAGPPVDPIGRASDVEAQAELSSAIRVAQVYFAENGTYVGLTPQVAAGYDPAIAFTSGPASPGSVSVRGLTATTVVLVTATKDGAYLCAAADSEVVNFGRADAAVPSQCTGGWA